MSLTKSEKNAWIHLGRKLQSWGYSFTTITPESHRRVLERPAGSESGVGAQALRALFGWSQSVDRSFLSNEVLDLLREAGVDISGGSFQSPVRFSNIEDMIFMHSAFPTESADAVFFGPDTYRFVSFLREHIVSAKNIVDIGAGSGAGGLWLWRHLHLKGQPAQKLFLTDINPRALDFAQVNAHIAEISDVQFVESDLLANVPQGVDLLLANPPFIMDPLQRSYRHGGDLYGAEFSLNVVKAALDFLPPGGRLALYTGSCVVKGVDVLQEEIKKLVAGRASMIYQEIDPDIFGEELSQKAYAQVERIAAVGTVITLHDRP